MTTWFAGNMIKFDGTLVEKKMSNDVEQFCDELQALYEKYSIALETEAGLVSPYLVRINTSEAKQLVEYLREDNWSLDNGE